MGGGRDRQRRAGQPVSVLLVTADPRTSIRLKRALAADPRLELVAEAADGKEGLSEIKRLRPDAVVLDIDGSVPDGEEMVKVARREGLDVKVMLLGGGPTEQLMFSALREANGGNGR